MALKPGGIARTVVLLSVIALAGVAGAQLYSVVPVGFHKGVFAAGALLTTLFGSFCVQIISKLEKMLQDSKGFPKKRMAQVANYVRGKKARAIFWMVATVGAILLTGVMAGLLQATVGNPRIEVIVGYTAIVFGVLNLARLLSIYLGLDRVDTDLFMQMQEEKARMETLKKMRRDDLLGSFDDEAAPPHIVGYRQ